MRKAPVVILIAMLIGGSLAAGVPAAFATPELEGLGNNAPGNSQYGPTGPVASFAVQTATRGILAGSTASAVSSGHAELK
jgi:hypothetical protein